MLQKCLFLKISFKFLYFYISVIYNYIIFLEKRNLKIELIFCNNTWGSFNPETRQWNGVIGQVKNVYLFLFKQYNKC